VRRRRDRFQRWVIPATSPASTPTAKVEISFDSTPLSTGGTWTDVSAYVTSIEIRRGKARELDQTPAGSATITLDDPTGLFDPDTTTSPYYPNITPLRRVRVTASWCGHTYYLFSGFVTGWPRGYEGIAVSTTQVRAVDGFGVLNVLPVSAAFAQELSSTRFTNVLDAAGWPSSLVATTDSAQVVQAVTLDEPPMSHLHAVSATEGGLMFMAADGTATFLGRHGMGDEPLDESSYTFGNGSSAQHPWDALDVDDDLLDLWTQVEVSSQGVLTTVVDDTAAQANYLVRKLTKSGMLFTSTADQTLYGQWLLAGFSTPRRRISKVSFGGADAVEFWDRLLDRELGSKVTAVWVKPSGATLSQRSFIEGIDWTIRAGDQGERWDCSFALVPLDNRYDLFILDSPTQGVLDQNALGY